MMKLENFNEEELKNALLVQTSWLEEEPPFNCPDGITSKLLQEQLGIPIEAVNALIKKLLISKHIEATEVADGNYIHIKCSLTSNDYLSGMVQKSLNDISFLIFTKLYEWYVRNNYQIDTQENSFIICLALGIKNHEKIINAISNYVQKGLFKKWVLTNQCMLFGLTIQGVSYMETLIENSKQDSSTEQNNTTSDKDFTKVFIVHGRDELAKVEVARFIEKLDLQPIILNEQANLGMTIIEKIEHYSNVNFGIVLYTPCDVGSLKDGELKPRARQNVVFEHGYLIGKLQRQNICALVKDNVETPNDISGIVYIPMDDNKAWQFAVAKELRNAGYEIDMNKL